MAHVAQYVFDPKYPRQVTRQN
ncbi:Protein of unknown function [Anaplasma phagocytophilum]|uniref:Uncharacterized protein n=1 Tax=Anaplasma phagocytophilum TaxID=948 RepID=A0A098EFT2_ANAPH|nr:Protein of unknown function [Anaplasma phagocytophilum]